MTTDHLTPEQKAEAPLFFGDGSGWGFGVAMVARRDDVSATPEGSAGPANFYEKADIVKGRRGGPSSWPSGSGPCGLEPLRPDA